MDFISLRNITTKYGSGEAEISALKGINLSVDKGEFVVILGSSGAGKSTMLNIIGGMDNATSGKYYVDKTDVTALSDKELAAFRRRDVGFVFQFYNLIPNLTVKENIQVCEYLTKNPLDLDDLLETLGLTAHQNKFPSQLSGGQQQRCAIARALIKNPKLLLCDEPTGALDSNTSRDILVLLEEINAKYGTTMLIVTHNNSIKNMVHKVLLMKDGLIHKSYENEVRVPARELEDL